MENLKRKIDHKKREIEALILEALMKAESLDHHPEFPIADKLRKCCEYLQSANLDLFMSIQAISENRNVL